MKILTVEQYSKFGHYLIKQDNEVDYDSLKDNIKIGSVYQHNAFGNVKVISIEDNNTGADDSVPYLVKMEDTSKKEIQKQNIAAFAVSCKIDN